MCLSRQRKLRRSLAAKGRQERSTEAWEVCLQAVSASGGESELMKREAVRKAGAGHRGLGVLLKR